MRLRLTGPNGERREFDTAGKSRVDIGRTDDNDVAISSITVSRYHCRLVIPNGAKPVLEDLGSRYGTRVNNVPISGPTVLNDDDCFAIGSWMGQVVETAAGTASSDVGQEAEAEILRNSVSPTQELDLPPPSYISSQATPSVWSTSHKVLVAALGLIVVALIVYIFASS